MRVWRSRDLIAWESLGPIFTVDDTVRAQRGEEITRRLIWAPELHWLGDRWALVHCRAGLGSLGSGGVPGVRPGGVPGVTWGQTLFSVLVIVSTILAARFRSWRDGAKCFSAGRIRLLTLSGWFKPNGAVRSRSVVLV